MRNHMVLLVAAAAALVLTSCSSPAGAAAGADIAPSVSITAPVDGATVASTFTLQFASSLELGPTDSGRHHVHVFTDGHTDDYTVVTSTDHQITNLAPGPHTIGVTLQNADHSPAGAGTEITVSVTGGPSDPTTAPSGGGGSGY